MRWLEKHHMYTIATGDRTDVVYEIEQPTRDRIVGKLVWELDKLTYTLPGLKQAWRWGEKTADVIDAYLHEKSCNGDCGTWYTRLPDDPPGQFPMDEERAHPGCVRTPMGVRWDCWIYDVTHRNQKYVTQYKLSKRL